LLISPEKGAETSVYLACSEEVAGVSGHYFSKQKPVEVTSRYNTLQNQKQLWAATQEILKSA